MPECNQQDFSWQHSDLNTSLGFRKLADVERLLTLTEIPLLICKIVGGGGAVIVNFSSKGFVLINLSCGNFQEGH